jgi:hypothetical protein
MTGTAHTPFSVELARVTEAADLARFVRSLGLAVRRDGTTVEIADARADIERAVTSWLAEWHAPLVPDGRDGRTLTLRPPAD